MNLDNLIKKKIWLAPLAGMTDKAFRTIAKNNDADVMVSEMVSADGLVYDYNRSIGYTDFDLSQRPFGIQLFGSNANIMAKACELAIEKKPDFIDINMGCPVKKVVKRGAGAALMLNPSLAGEIISNLKKITLSEGIFLSVKIRSGYDNDKVNALDFAKMCQDCGADILILHPRTKTQMYNGISDWSLIKEVKKILNIPLIGNGDINSSDDALRMYNDTQCDSIMIGRAALRKPWIFREIKEFLLTGNKFNATIPFMLKLVKEHYLLKAKYLGRDAALKQMRTHVCYYTRGLRNGAHLRNFINKADDFNEIMKELEFYYNGKD